MDKPVSEPTAPAEPISPHEQHIRNTAPVCDPAAIWEFNRMARDAACWRAFKGNHELLWADQRDGTIKWLRYIEMPAPLIGADELTATSVMEHLEKHLLQL